MCSKKIEKEINDLHALVSNLDPNENGDDGYIEIVEVPAPNASTPKPTPTPVKAPAHLKPALPPPTKSPNIFERTFSFNGATDRRYFFWNSLVLLIASAVVLGLVDAGEMAEGWGVLALGIAAWSLVVNTAKRWRDTGYNMWWLTTLLIPYVNLITILFVLFAPSKRSP
ncbi:MAG: DUF805 domain-containing protein [Planctomycetaceae bacterium]|nr:DUF805 domain-containing protein [Planctomycetaceae bacterium]